MTESTDPLSTRTWLSIEQAAEYTTLAAVTLRKLIYIGAVRYYKVGRRVVFKRDEIDIWMGTSLVAPIDTQKVREEFEQLINRERKTCRPKLIPSAKRSQSVEAAR